MPGVPDVYQGDELIDLSLVDPDNRRPVDWEARRAALDALRDGVEPTRETMKLHLIWRALELRARRPEAFAGAYTPLDAGPDALAFTRGEDGEVLVVVRAARAGARRDDRRARPGATATCSRATSSDLAGPTPAAPLAEPHGFALLERG